MTQSIMLAELPVIETQGGELSTDIVEAANPADLAGGFVLKETDIETWLASYRLHSLHRAVAARLLLRSGILPNVRQVLEYPKGRAWGGYTAQHVDGLTNRYYQVNTTLPAVFSGTVAFSKTHLFGYQLTTDEHAKVVAEARRLSYPSCFKSLYPRDRGDVIEPSNTLDLPFFDRPFDTYAQATIGPDRTIVFPNGYNTYQASQPDTFYMHTVESVEDQQGETSVKQRTVAMSRICASAFANEV